MKHALKRNLLFCFLFALFSQINYSQVIADHTIVDKFDEIPAYYINEVKKMWVSIAGESHSQAYRTGLLLLESSNSAYSVSVVESGTPEAYTTSNLRFSRATWGDVDYSSGWIYSYGEEDWYTNSTAIARTKAGLLYCKNNGPALTALGFGWCWDPTWTNGVGGGYDPVYYTRWAGASANGPQGNLRWGLDAGDQSLTDNSVCMDTYINATQSYIDYCTANNISTKIIWTTGPVDNESNWAIGESGYQQYLKWKYIRDHVYSLSGAYFFDYADILSYNNAGVQTATTWTDNNGTLQTFPMISPENMVTLNPDYHIGSNGAIKLAKAMWWLLARMAGWDGGTTSIPVNSITVTGTGGATSITTDGGSLQMVAAVLPANATNKTVTWSVTSGSAYGTINSTTGVLTAVDNGTVTVRATATDGSNVYGSTNITISGQVIPVSSITVTGTGGAIAITTDGGSLQMVAAVLPANATNKTVTWSIATGSAYGTINSTTGVLTAVDNGTVTVRGTATDGSNVYGSINITISGQTTPVSSITVTGQGGATSITTDGSTLQMVATVLPANATNKTVTWSITSGSAYATINSATGLLTAVDNGTLTVRAAATDGSNVYGSTNITISGQTTPVTSITVTGQGGATSITTDGSSLQMVATVLPTNATNKIVTWSITNGSAYATINPTSGLLTAVDNGTVTVRATATDGSNVYGSTNITISGQTTPVNSITVTGQGGATTITSDGATLQMVATVLPANATNKTVTWSITNGSAYATINPTSGLLTAVDNGTVTVRATATDGSNLFGSTNITISGQTTPVSSITVAGQGGATSITTDGSTLQMVATVLPSNATNKTVTWSITSGSAYATINPTSGLLTAVDNGTVTVRATATDGSNVFGSTNITISGQTTPVSSITVSGQGGASSIITDGSTLQMVATILPSNATNKTVTWSITSGSAYATISPTSGLLTALDNGTVTVRATATDGSNVSGSAIITISGQITPVSSITVSGAGGVSVITSIGGTLQLSAVILPANATNKNVTWSITNGTGQATISSSGLVTAVAYGIVTARASAVDDSGISGTMQITIASQLVPVTGITLSGGTSINTDGGTLQLSANITPANATVKTVTWSISDGQDKATISSSGLVTATDNGTIIVRATANDGSGVSGTLTIIITNQIIPVTGISLSGGSAISTPGGTLQLTATVTPVNATDKSIIWSITGGTGQATISQSGLVTAISNGSVIVRATANGGSNVYGTVTITVTSQTVLVTAITVTASGGSTAMTGIGTTLQLNAAVSPANASNKSVVWSVVNGTGQATISSTGLLTSVSPGTITANASASDGSGVSGTLSVNILSNIISVSGISVTGEGGKNSIDEPGGTLQLIAEVTPADASDKSLTWSLNNGSGRATISSAGLVTAEETGTVTATATANDGSGISGSMQIEIYIDPNESLLPYINGQLLKVPLSRRFVGKRISLYDIYGRLLAAEIAESDLHEFNISKFHPGLYLIVLTDEFVLKVNKVVLP